MTLGNRWMRRCCVSMFRSGLAQAKGGRYERPQAPAGHARGVRPANDLATVRRGGGCRRLPGVAGGQGNYLFRLCIRLAFVADSTHETRDQKEGVLMPLYDFECPHGHRFEKIVSMAESDDPVPCEGIVVQLRLDIENDEPDLTQAPVACMLQAIPLITHSNPAGALDHGASANRDAAREGRYDPLNPNRRFMAKGRGYRK